MGDFFPTNQSYLQSFRRVLIGWKNVSPLEKALIFWADKPCLKQLACLTL